MSKPLIAGEEIEPGDPVYVGQDGRAYRLALPPPRSGFSVICHPDNLEALIDRMKAVRVPGSDLILTPAGDEVRTSPHMARTSDGDPSTFPVLRMQEGYLTPSVRLLSDEIARASERAAGDESFQEMVRRLWVRSV